MADITLKRTEDVKGVPLDTLVTTLKTKLDARRDFEGQMETKRDEMNQIKQDADADIQPTLRDLVLKLGLFESLPADAVVSFSYSSVSEEEAQKEEAPAEE